MGIASYVVNDWMARAQRRAFIFGFVGGVFAGAAIVKLF